MPRVNAQQFTEKHARRLKASIPDIQAGIERVTESPTAKAAKKSDKMLQGITRAVQSGKWSRNLNRVTLEEWKSNAVSKGIGRISAGIDAAQPKVQAFAEKLLPFEATLQAKVNAMPDLTIEDSISRATMWIREMSKFSNG